LPDGDACAWFDAARTVCSAPGCIVAERARLRAAHNAEKQAAANAKSKYRGMGYGAIVADMRREQQRRRRKRRAA
jgi:hypothetical protein